MSVNPNSPNLFLRLGTGAAFVLGPYDTACGRRTINGRSGELYWCRRGSAADKLMFAPTELRDKLGRPLYWYEVADRFEVAGSIQRYEAICPPTSRSCGAAQKAVDTMLRAT
jgi:hypothetical protein